MTSDKVNRYGPYVLLVVSLVLAGYISMRIRVDMPAIVPAVAIGYMVTMLAIVRDRNKEIRTLGKMLDSTQKQLDDAKRPQPEYLGTFRTAVRAHETEKARKRRLINELKDRHPQDLDRISILEKQLRATEQRQLIPIHEIRIGHAERDQALELLGDHYAAGHLDSDEFEERTDKAAHARTAVQLAELFKDMP